MSTIAKAGLGLIGMAAAPISMVIRNGLRMGGNQYADNVLLKGIEDGFEKTYQSYLKSSSMAIGEMNNYTMGQTLQRFGKSVLVHLHAAALVLWAPFRGLLNIVGIGAEKAKTLHQQILSKLPSSKADYLAKYKAAIERLGASDAIKPELIKKTIDRLFSTYSKAA